MAEVFADWNEGKLASYLIEITAEVLAYDDPDTGQPLVDLILDAAEQKGTGRWTSQNALELGSPIPTIDAAVFARSISSMKAKRVAASEVLHGPDDETIARVTENLDRDGILAELEAALSSPRFRPTRREWRFFGRRRKPMNGDSTSPRSRASGRAAASSAPSCSIRFGTRSARTPSSTICCSRPISLMGSMPARAPAATSCRWPAPWRAGSGAQRSARLLRSYRTASLPANLMQGQRDYFGAHTYRRIDREGIFHTEWAATVPTA